MSGAASVPAVVSTGHYLLGKHGLLGASYYKSHYRL